jgi:long-chain acyl-CoA synthetase
MERAAEGAAAADRPWLAHYAPGVPHALPVPDRSLVPLFDESVRRYATRPAIEYFGASISYAQLGALVVRFAQALVRLGVRPGDRVSLCLPNCPQFPIAFYGALKAGALVVPTNPVYTGPELEHQFRDAGVAAAVVIEQALPTLAAVRAATPVEHVIVTGVDDYFPLALALAYKVKEARESFGKPHADIKGLRAAGGVSDFKGLLGGEHLPAGESATLPDSAGPDEIAILQYTGGTTGLAKGAMLTHRNLATNAIQAWAWSQLSPDTPHKVLSIAPFFHVFGLTVCMNLGVLNGATLVLLPRFHVSDALRAIEQSKPDLFPGVPAMYMALARAVERKKVDLSSIRICISGSAPLSLETQRQFEAVSGARVVEGYGLTEAGPVTHCNPVFGAPARIGTIGLPLPDTDAAILDPVSNTFLPPGEQGELVVRGPQVMAGYWQRPDETAETLRDGWLHTGDIATMDADGFFRIVDRAKDMIIVGGLKVFPRQVEDVLFDHPKVLEAAVIGLPDARKGEQVVAYVVPVPGEHLTPEELAAYSRERLAPYKVPRRFELRDSLPKTIVGKVLRRQLKEAALAAGTGDAEADDEAG